MKKNCNLRKNDQSIAASTHKYLYFKKLKINRSIDRSIDQSIHLSIKFYSSKTCYNFIVVILKLKIANKSVRERKKPRKSLCVKRLEFESRSVLVWLQRHNKITRSKPCTRDGTQVWEGGWGRGAALKVIQGGQGPGKLILLGQPPLKFLRPPSGK